jgi:hypothetical protein
MNQNVSSLFQKITNQEYLSRNIQNELEQNNYELISSVGVDRLVFTKNKQSVIKVARNKDKIDTNYDETAFWNQTQNRDLFCPIIDNCPHYTWIEMMYCDTTPEEFEIYKEKINNSGYYIDDLHPDNIGRINGSKELVCFDYSDAVEI